MLMQSSLKDLPGLVRKLGMQRPLLVCSGRWESRLHSFLPSCPVFSQFHANPDFVQCEAGLKLLRQNQCDGIIAMGGGSAMDTAKTIKAMNLSDTPMDALKMGYREEKLPLLCIPTTAGSGSEATQTAVVYVENQKVSLSHPALLPDATILDPVVLESLPYAQKRSCALDALCQAIESFWSNSSTEESRAIAGAVIPEIFVDMPIYLLNAPPTYGPMLHLSHDAGRAIQITRTTAAHAMSYQLTKLLGIPHGDACALTLPFLWMRLAEKELPVCEALAHCMGLVDPMDPPFVFLGMCRASGLTAPGMPDANTLDALVASVNLERLGNHPEPLSADDIREVYTLALDPDAAAPYYEQADDFWREYVEGP